MESAAKQSALPAAMDRHGLRPRDDGRACNLAMTGHLFKSRQ